MSRIDLPKIYNPAIQTPEELIDNFVVRTSLFAAILKDIKSSKMDAPEQHYIIRGIRGQGKTTLLLRLTYEIKKDKQLNKRIIPLCFNEEQYNISRLFKLWETVAEHLQEYAGFDDLYDRMQQLEDDDDYEVRCFELLEATLKANNKKLLLFIDNIDDLLNKFSRTELQRLREVFTECVEIRVIGASAGVLEFHHKYSEPFYEFFKIPMLKGLTTEETKTLLLKLSAYYKKEEVAAIVKNQPGRVESLRRITGGVIRTIVIMFQMFADDPDGRAFLDLETILDSVTPLYKERMDRLSPQHQEIVDCIALNWDAITAGEIAKKTKISSKAVSAQLKQLEKYHIIEKVGTSTKNYLYRIAERFFNIWYLMRHGRKWDEKRVRFLVEFLQLWCDKDDLKSRALSHLKSVKEGRCCDKQAWFMTEALSQTPIGKDLQHLLLSTTRSYLEKGQSSLTGHLSKSDKELIQAAAESEEAGEVSDAIKKYEAIRHKDGNDFNTIGVLYIQSGDLESAEEALLMSVDKGDADAMYNLALLYETEYKDYKQAEEYYRMAVDKGHVEAMNNLGVLYKFECKDLKQAEKYYRMAVDKGYVGAMNNLGLLYVAEYKDFDQAEKYFLMAADKGHVEAMNNLGVLYKTERKDLKQAEEYYRTAVDKGHVGAMNNLGFLHATDYKNFKQAETYFQMAVKKDNADAMYHLGVLYETEYKEFKQAEKYYLMAVEKKQIHAMNSLAWLYFKQKQNKAEALTYARSAFEKNQETAIAHTYAMILLWHDMIDTAIETADLFLADKDIIENYATDVRQFLMLLIAKKQYHTALNIFKDNPCQLQDRFKPVYYALMHLLKDEYPDEWRKMGEELKETVDEIIDEISQMAEDYS